jgi:hypothetical protein
VTVSKGSRKYVYAGGIDRLSLLGSDGLQFISAGRTSASAP